ncbi:MAG: undecaprenyl-phosphate glucose phosphotransferase [Polaribacter sp.]
MKHRYSHFIRPIQLVVDLILIIAISFYFNNDFLNPSYLIYISVYWMVSSYFSKFYKVHRFNRVLRIFTLLFRQFVVFILGYFAYFGLFREGELVGNQFLVLVTIISSITIVKISWFVLLKKYRALGKNYRITIVAGYDEPSKNIIKLFKSKSNLGYRFLGFFANRPYKNSDYLGKVSNIKTYLESEFVDEIYCSLSSLSANEITELKKIATEKTIIIKLIPDTTELYSKDQKIEYYDDALMVVNVKKLPFEFEENYYIKRFFDIFFSLIIIIFILSWLYPILWVLIKLESRGPVIFKQKREGLNVEHFVCYKFRSMRSNELSDKVHARKDDDRVTKIGAFLRRTSIDELPQFINVLKGDMSVVGPRPHLESLSLEYQKDVEDYLKRHLMKPGITGLAQISGYRGEIRKKADIKNRVRLDIFYIENWSFLLDLKIIFQTVLNIFKGDENAY